MITTSSFHPDALHDGYIAICQMASEQWHPSQMDSFRQWLQVNLKKGGSSFSSMETPVFKAGEQSTRENRRMPYFDLTLLEREINSPMDEDRNRFLQFMKRSGHLRERACLPDYIDLYSLRENFPNFAEVTDFLEKQIRLCMLSSENFAAFQPLLLLGAPGVGKTRYMFEVSQRLGLEFSLIQCGGVSANFVLSGSSTSWKSGKPGKIHTTLRDGKTINPIVLLDEIDKLSGDVRYDANGPLYQLLEKKTAAVFSDEAVEIPMNCSHLIWVATANHLDQIPEAIQSRLIVIDVPAPNREQIPKIALSIYRDMLQEYQDTWGPAFSTDLSPEVIEMFYDMTPRDIRKKLVEAFGRAAMRSGAKHSLSLQREDIMIRDAQKKNAFGFIAK
jgi:ATP-dependent Lon protease